MRVITVSLLVVSLVGCSKAFSSPLRSPLKTTLRTRMPLKDAIKASSDDSSGEIDGSNDMAGFVSRREMLKTVGWNGAAAVSAAFLPTATPPAAHASGGATAGGAYLLSAKQRYNERVVKGLTAFVALGDGSGALSMAAAKDFFAADDVGGWQDTSTAGYLLANAFRTNSTTPPDRLPAVKAWKAFAKEVESMMKSIKKKESKGAAAAYANAIGALDAYLKEVELQL